MFYELWILHDVVYSYDAIYFYVSSLMLEFWYFLYFCIWL